MLRPMQSIPVVPALLPLRGAAMIACASLVVGTDAAAQRPGPDSIARARGEPLWIGSLAEE